MSQVAEGKSYFQLSQSKKQFSKVEQHHLPFQIFSEKTLNSGIFLFLQLAALCYSSYTHMVKKVQLKHVYEFGS